MGLHYLHYTRPGPLWVRPGPLWTKDEANHSKGPHEYSDEFNCRKHHTLEDPTTRLVMTKP